jgi:prepilin peptidase CpaA
LGGCAQDCAGLNFLLTSLFLLYSINRSKKAFLNLLQAKEIVLISVLFFSVTFDLWVRRIPNWLTMSGAVAGLTLNCFGGLAQFLHGFFGLLLGLGLLILPFALGWLGAGDVKLFGAVGAILGVQWIPRVLFYSGVAGGILALFIMVVRGVDLKGFKNLWNDFRLFVVSLGQVLPESVSHRTANTKSIPWAVPIGLGVLVAFYLDPNGRWAGF